MIYESYYIFKIHDTLILINLNQNKSVKTNHMISDILKGVLSYVWVQPMLKILY